MSQQTTPVSHPSLPKTVPSTLFSTQGHSTGPLLSFNALAALKTVSLIDFRRLASEIVDLSMCQLTSLIYSLAAHQQAATHGTRLQISCLHFRSSKSKAV